MENSNKHKQSNFDKSIRSADDIGTGAKFDDAVKAADKAFDPFRKVEKPFLRKKNNG